MNVWADLRHSARTLRHEPAFALVAILTIALGIGANTAIFSIVNGVLLSPLPYAEPDRLVSLREVLPQIAQTYPTLPVSARHFVEWRQRSHSFERLSVIDPSTATLTGTGEPETLDIMRVSADVFRTLGARAAVGRTFLDGDDSEGKQDVAILSYSLWQRRFNADQRIVGRTIHLDDRPLTVVGVLPAWFRCPTLSGIDGGKSNSSRTDVFVPIVFSKEAMSTLMGMFNYNVIARLKRGVTAEAATAELNVIAGQLVKLSGEKVELRSSVTPLLDSMVGRSRRGLMVLLGAVAAVLLIVCVNLANFMLARGERSARESAIRTALGAGAGTLVRQALTEALLIAMLGGAVGVALAAGGLGVLVKSAPAEIPRLDEVHVDARVLLFALAITTGTGLLFGLAPAWRAGRTDPLGALKSGAQTSTSTSGGLRLRSTLVAAEVGLSAVLLMIAALLMSSFFRVIRSGKGFEAPAVLAADVKIPAAKYRDDAQSNQFHQRVLAGLRAQPGVLSAAFVSALPLEGETWIDTVSTPGDTRSSWEQPSANVRFISSDYFRTMGIPIRSGRPLNDDDQRNAVLVSESLAQVLWPGRDAIGRHLMDGGVDRQVIGVTGDVRPEPDKPPVAMVYRPYWDWAPLRVIVVARAAGDPRSIAGSMRAAVSSVDRDVPLAEIRTMREVLDQSVAQRRFQMRLAITFASTALLLAMLGIYAVVSYSVARRTNEIGLRTALGAQAYQLYALILRQAMLPVVWGLVAGLAAAFAAGRVLASLLYQVNAHDPGLLAAAAVLLAGLGLAASFLPARKAIHMGPLKALRNE